MTVAPTHLILEAIAGPRPLNARLPPDGPHIVGRGEKAAVLLTDTGNTISRHQANLVVERHGGERRWCIKAVSDRVPTRLNGIVLTPGHPVPLQDGDLLTIGPWTLQVVPEGQTSIRRRATHDDGGIASTLRSVQNEDLPALGRDWLRPLLRLAEELHAADSAVGLATAVTEALAEATRFRNVAYTSPLGVDGSIEVLAIRTADGRDGEDFRFSRSTLREAALGQVVHRTRSDTPVNIEVSMVALDISEAICVPVRSGDVVVGLIYMDNRRGLAASAGEDEDLAFAVALGRLASLAVHGLLNRQVGSRLAKMQGELTAAAEAQRLILPPGDGVIAACTYAGRCDPGQELSGDFFDIFPLPDGRIAVALGDSCGKGIVASVLATLVQGYLRGTLGRGGSLASSVTALNEYLVHRGDGGRFITTWMAVVDPGGSTIEYLDAGHGFALMIDADGAIADLSRAGGPPLGAIEKIAYESATVAFPENSTLVLTSDGVIEQSAGDRRQFGMDGFRGAIDPRRSPAEIVHDVLAAVRSFAGKKLLDDDATVVALRHAELADGSP